MIDSLQNSVSNSIFETQSLEEKSLLEEKIEDMSVLEAGYIFSIELKRQKIRSDLKDFFEFEHLNQEVDFLDENGDVLHLLPSIGEFLKKSFGKDSILSLELLSEENDWETLFINVEPSDSKDWNYLNDFKNSFFDHMFGLFPNTAEKINIDIH